MRSLLRGWLLALAAWWLALAACAAGLPALPVLPALPALPVGGAERHALSPHLEYLEDPQGRLTLQDVLLPAVAGRFAPRPEGNSLGYTPSVIWVRVALQQPAQEDPRWLLELAYPPLDHVEVFAPQPAGGYQRLLAGDHEARDRRALPHRNYVLPMTLPAGTSVLYLRLRSDGTMVVPLSLWRPQALWRHDQRSYALLSLYYGLALGLALYNLLLFVAVRDVAYLIYVAYVLSLATAQAALNGLGRQFLWPRADWWNGAAPNLALSVAVVFGLMFVRSFLVTRHGLPRLDRALQVLMAAWGLTALSANVLLPYVVSGRLITWLAGPTVLLLFFAGFAAWRRGQSGARAYLAACAALLAGGVTLLLHDLGLVPSNAFTVNALLIGAGVEMVLLSFALASRINVARRFKQQAQLRLAAEHALVESLGEAQRQLRTALQEREGLLENALVGIAFVSPAGRLTWSNRALQEMFGTTRRKEGSMERFYLSREQYLEVGQEAAAVLARGEAYRREVQLQRADGSRLWVRLSSRAVREYDDTQGTAWVLVDISREKELEARLEALEGERGAGGEAKEGAAP